MPSEQNQATHRGLWRIAGITIPPRHDSNAAFKTRGPTASPFFGPPKASEILKLPIFLSCSLAFLHHRCVLDPGLARGLMGGPLFEDNVLAILVVERVKLGEGPSLLLLWRRPNGGDVIFASPGLATRRTRAPIAAPNRVSKQFLDEREKSRNAGADQDKVCFDAWTRQQTRSR